MIVTTGGAKVIPGSKNAVVSVIGKQARVLPGTAAKAVKVAVQSPAPPPLTNGDKGGVIVNGNGVSIWPKSDIRAYAVTGTGIEDAGFTAAEGAAAAGPMNLGGLHVSTMLDPRDLGGHYWNGRVYGWAPPYNAKTVYPNRLPVFDSEIQSSSTQSPMLDLDDIECLWLGTSIPQEGGALAYPMRVGKALGFHVLNMAWAGSSNCYDKAGDPFNVTTIKRLSMTQDDVNWGIATYGPTSVYNDTDLVNKASKMTVEEGTSAGATFRQTAVNGTIGSSAVTWSTFGTGSPAATETTAGIAEIATQAETDTGTDDQRMVTPLKLATWAGRKLKYSATFGDGSATQYDLTHNLNTLDVSVQVYRLSDGATVITDMTRLNVNTVRINTAAAVASSALRAVILG